MKHIALLRGINVGGHRKILMKDLKQALTQLGLNDVQTYIQSGNVVFCTDIKNEADLADAISNKIKTAFGHDVPVVVRTKDYFEEIMAQHPFLPNSDQKNLYIAFFDKSPKDELIETFKELDFDGDVFTFGNKCLYLNYSRKFHQSKLTNSVIEKKLQVHSTARNHKTCEKLLSMLTQD